MPPLVGRLLAVAFLAALMLSAWTVVVRPVVVEFEEMRARGAQVRELIERYRRINATRGELEAELERVRSTSPRDVMLAGDDPTAVTTELLERVSGTIKRRGGELLSIESLAMRGERGLGRAAVRVQFAASTEALADILYGLEGAEPYLFIDNLHVRAGQGTDRPELGNGGPWGRADGLLVTCDVYGYARDNPA